MVRNRQSVMKSCKVCGKEYRVYNSELKRSYARGMFCSIDCRVKHLATIPVSVKFARHVAPPDENGCTVWTGGRKPNGYGCFGHENKTLMTHRVAWEIANGPIPEGLIVCHKCDNPPCVNPDHLFLGTYADNMQDAAAKGRIKRKGAIGERNSGAKIKEPDVLEIRRLANDGTPAMELAKRYNLNRTTIRNIVTKRTWKHL